MRTLLLGLLVMGCSSAKDPCEGEAGACLTARVEGDVGALDQLRITIDKPAKSVTTPQPASLFTLPVKLALTFPSNTSGAILVTVEGLRNNTVIGRSSQQTVTPPAPGSRAMVTFVLAPVTGGDTDMTAADMNNPDLKAGLVVETSANNFPDTPRGQKSSTQITVTLTNKSMSAMTFSGNPMPTGDLSSFSNEPTGTCAMSMTGFAAGQSCTLVISFTPQKSAALSITNTLNFTDGSTATFTLGGKGTPVWSNERLNGVSMLDFTSVHGTDSSNVFAGGQTTAAAGVSPIWRYNGSSWNSYTTNNLFDKLTITSLWVGSQHVWAGHPSAISFNTGMGADWTTEAMALSGRVRGFYADSLLNAFAVTDGSPGFMAREPNGTGGFNWNSKPGVSFLQAICGASKSQVYMFGGASFYRWDGNGLQAPNLAPPAMVGQIQACWFDPIKSAVYAVSYETAGTFTSRVYRIDIDTGTGNPTNNPPAAEITSANMTQYSTIHGRHLPTGEWDMYVGGTFGGILHSRGTTWGQESIPLTGSMPGIHVAPAGQVVPVGFGADIAHLY